MNQNRDEFEMHMYEANMYFLKGTEFEKQNNFKSAKEFYGKAYEIYRVALLIAKQCNDKIFQIRANNALTNTLKLFYKMNIKINSEIIK